MICKSLSASSVKTYLQCPLKYYYTYEMGHRQEAEHLTFGTLIHTVLERWFQEDKDIMEIYKEEWANGGITSLHYYRLGKDILTSFIQKNKKEEILSIGFEQEFELEISPGVNIKGFIDRIDIVDGETIEIIDYKTSYTTLNSYQLEEDIQLSMYDLAASIMFPEYPKRILTLDYLRYGKVSTTRTEEYRSDFKEWLIDLYNKISNDNDPKPNINEFCSWCECKNQCEAYNKLLKENPEFNITPDSYSVIWDEINSINHKIKILDARKKELQQILKTEFEENQRESIPLGNGKELYQASSIRYSYPLSVVMELFPDDWHKFVSVRKTEIDKAVGKDENLKKVLDMHKETYFVEPTLRERKVK